MMKVVGFCMSCWFVVAFMLFNSFGGGVNRSMLLSGVMTAEANIKTTGATSRNLKEIGYHYSFDGESHHGDVSLEDYRPFDPSPSSKASVKPGPIQHGTPLIPYIPTPKPSPPRSSGHDGDPQS